MPRGERPPIGHSLETALLVLTLQIDRGAGAPHRRVLNGRPRTTSGGTKARDSALALPLRVILRLRRRISDTGMVPGGRRCGAGRRPQVAQGKPPGAEILRPTAQDDQGAGWGRFSARQ